jgi:hypothetical protein
LGIVDIDKCPFLLEVADKRDSRRLAGVTRVSLEGKAKNSNTLQQIKVNLTDAQIKCVPCQ